VSRPSDKPAGGPDDGAAVVDWWKIADIAVWVAVAVVAALAVEWLMGAVVRENIATGFRRYLARESAGTPETEPS
jgi:hypothetical protein